MEIANGRYVLGELLGRGGFAAVYRTQDTALGVQRAVKILEVEARVRDSLRARLQAEARVMAKLNHPNILSIHDIGTDGEVDYVVMELAEGGSLGERVDVHGPMPPAEAIRYCLQVLSALAAAHAEGIVHRDVNPNNILLDHTGTAMLADFGIALVAESGLRTTRTGVAMGTMAFMAPEQRLDARSVGPAADVYGLAATLYHLLTGANPVDLFAAGPSSPRWADLPDDICRVLQKGLEYEPDDRYPDARSMARELLSLLDDAGDVAFLTAVQARDPERFPSPSLSLSRGASKAGGSGPTLVAVTASEESTLAAITFLVGMSEDDDLHYDEEAIRQKTEGRSVTTMPDVFTLIEEGHVTPEVEEEFLGGVGAPVGAPGPTEDPTRTGHRSLALGLLVGAVLLVGVPWTLSRVFGDGAESPTVAETPAVAQLVAEGPTPLIEPVDEPGAFNEAALVGAGGEGEALGEGGTRPPPSQAEALGSSEPASGSPQAQKEAPAASLAVVRTDGSTSTTTPPETAPDVATGLPFGRWSGTYGGENATFALDGSHGRVVGTVTVTSIFGSSVDTPVTGRYDSGTRALVLEDRIDGSDAGEYRLVFNPDGSGFKGSWSDRSGLRKVSVMGYSVN